MYECFITGALKWLICYQSMWPSYHSQRHICKHSPVHCGKFLRSPTPLTSALIYELQAANQAVKSAGVCVCVRQEATGKAPLLCCDWESRQVRTDTKACLIQALQTYKPTDNTAAERSPIKTNCKHTCWWLGNNTMTIWWLVGRSHHWKSSGNIFISSKINKCHHMGISLHQNRGSTGWYHYT